MIRAPRWWRHCGVFLTAPAFRHPGRGRDAIRHARVCWRSWQWWRGCSQLHLYRVWLLGLEHARDASIALGIFGPSYVLALSLRLGLSLSLPAPPVVIILTRPAASMSSSMPLMASNLRLVNSSAELVAIDHDVGRSRATTRTRRAVSSDFKRSQSAVLRRDSRSTCSTSRTSPGCASPRSRNSSGRASVAPLSLSMYQAANRVLIQGPDVAAAFLYLFVTDV
jgi:hypothetical protein